MKGHQPTKTTGTMPPVTPPIKKELDIVALVEQLNGLLDRYNTLYSTFLKCEYAQVKEYVKTLKDVLKDIANAIKALCLRITEMQFILKVE